MDLFDAIYRRKSTRDYSDEMLPDKTLEEISEKTSTVEPLYPNSETEFQIRDWTEMEDFVSGLIGGYGKIEAPHYIIAFCGKDRRNLENLGYTLEKIVLEITGLGLATCWMGSHFDNDALKEEFGTIERLEPRTLIAFGKPGKGKDALRGDPDETSRKDLSEILLKDPGEVPEGWSKILDAARMAPSAMNSQPWRFDLNEEGIHVYTKSGEGIINKLGKALGNLGELNKIDAGIALRHIKIAADRNSKPTEFKRLEGKEKNGLSYVVSALEKG